MTEEQQTVKYVNGLRYTIQEYVAFHDMFSIDEAHNKAMTIERLQSRAPPSKRQLSIEEPEEGNLVQLSSTTAGQPLVQPTAKSSTSTPTTTPAVARSKDNPYSKPEIDKCYKCDEHGHKSNERPKRRQVKYDRL